MSRPSDTQVWGSCDWCRRLSYLERHDSGKYACPYCQMHPAWTDTGSWWDYEEWLADRGLEVDGWKSGWRPVAPDVP